ncbi:MAG: SsrA-binding protein SmpB [Actinobacteria bacterium]|jgi:SsrA-binding protein|nr:SsrA-binding protein SmpB [Actinomycetota bacterium]
MAPPGTKIIASNRRARHDYAISDSIEAGVSLLGSEVKSLREAQVQLADGYARFRNGELWLEGVAIAPYGFAVGFGAHEQDRPRKLLLHRAELKRLSDQVDRERVSIIPLAMYFKNGRVKVELGIGKGRTKADKRQSIAAKDAQRDIEREMGRRNKYNR